MIISRPIPLIFLWMLHVISFRGVKSFVVTRPSLEVTPDRYNNMVGSSLISTISYRPKFQCHRKNNVKLLLSLKPIATSLMDSGKAFARSGEFVIELTQSLDLYGGGLSSAGAQIRNAGDCIAQTAASCRFKTGLELVVDEIREAATCLIEASRKLQLASEEATVDDNVQFATVLRSAVPLMADCSTALESAGEGIMKRIPATQIGSYFLVASEKMEQLAVLLLPESILSADATNESSGNTAASITAASDASNRMMIASQQMKISGNLLIGIQPEVPKGRSFLKGGGM